MGRDQMAGGTGGTDEPGRLGTLGNGEPDESTTGIGDEPGTEPEGRDVDRPEEAAPGDRADAEGRSHRGG